MFNKKNEVRDFENALTEIGHIHYSRYIVSWLKQAIRHPEFLSTHHNRIEIIFGDEFEEWLESEGLTEEEIDHVRWMATNGKLELEGSACKWFKSI